MRAVNEKTGEVIEYVGGRWVPVAGTQQTGALPAQPQEDLSGGPIQSALIGAGDLATRMGRNARDLWAGMTGDAAAQRGIAAERAEADRIRARFREESPIAGPVGEFLLTAPAMALGGGLPGLAGMTGRAAGLSRMGAQAGLGAVQGAAGAESGDLAEEGALGGVMGAAGSALGAMMPAASRGARNMVSRIQGARADRVTQGIADSLASGRIDEETADLLSRAQKAGLRLTPGQAGNSNAARQIEAGLSSNPLTSGPFEAIDRANTRRLANLAGEAMGLGPGVESIGANAINTAINRVGRTFEQVGSKIDGVDPGAVAKLYRAAADAEAAVPGVRAFEPFAKAAEGIAEQMAAKGQTMTGKQLMEWRSRMVGEIQTLSKGSQPGTAGLRQAAWAVVSGIDDLIIEQAGKVSGSGDEAMALAKKYAEARKSWKMIEAVSDAVSAEGNVMPAKLHNVLKRVDPFGYERGNDASDLYSAVRFASSQLGRPIVGNSGTATRQVINEMMSNPSMWGAAALGARGVTGSLLGRAYLGMPGAADILSQYAANNAGQRIGGALGRFAGGL